MPEEWLALNVSTQTRGCVPVRLRPVPLPPPPLDLQRNPSKHAAHSFRMHHLRPGSATVMFVENSEVCQLRTEEDRILASFSRRLIEIAAGSGSVGSGSSAIAALNMMRLPAIALDGRGFVIGTNAAADAVFDEDIKIKDKRLFVRDLAARALLKASLDDLTNSAKLKFLISEPVIVQRPDKLRVIVRIWPFGGSANVPNRDVQALVTLSELGPKPGPPAAILAKTFRLTPSEAKVASIIARGASPQIAARELKISRETARNQLKSVFAKTDTHRQSELVALLVQVE